MEVFGRGFIVFCLALFATPLRSARITGVASPAASNPLPDSGKQESTVGQRTATDASDAVMVPEVASTTTTNVSKDGFTKSLQSKDNAEKQDERAFNQANAHPRPQLKSEPDVSSTVVQDGKAKMRTTKCLNGNCETENTQRVFGEHLGESSRDVAKVGSDAVPAREAGSITTIHSSKDEVIKSLLAEEAASKRVKRTSKQAGAQPRSLTKSLFNKPLTITPHGKGSPVHKSPSKPFVFLEVFSIFAFMGVLGYVFSLCL